MKGPLLNNIFFLCLLLPIQLFAQTASTAEKDITGLWKGSLYNDTTKKNLPYEIAISEEKGKFTGYSYTEFDIDGKKEIGVKRVKIKRKNEQLIIEDVELISNNYSEPPPKKVRQMSVVQLLVDDSLLRLTGNWSTNTTKEYRSLTGSLQLQRVNDYPPLALYKKLVDLKLEKGLSFVKTGNKSGEDIAVNNKPAIENKSAIVIASATSVAEKPKEIASTGTEKKTAQTQSPEAGKNNTNQIVGASAVIKTSTAGEKVTKPANNPTPTGTATTSTKKNEVLVAGAGNKENKKPTVDKPATTPPPPVTRKTETAQAVKEPAKKESNTANDIAGKPINTEKPAVITTAIIANNTSPVSSQKEPLKSENKNSIAIATAPEPKKETAPVVKEAPVPLAAVNVKERKMSNEQSVFFESDSLMLTLYDNGDVDGDTVSVLMNGQIIFARQGLSVKANSKTIYMDKGMPDSLSLVMYAENLGSIPPNTGLLVIMDGEKRYEVRFSADLKTNSAILLKRKRN